MAIILLPAQMRADSFSSLWKQVDAARAKDLPQSELALLRKISAKAQAEKAYGHLLKAEMLAARCQVQVSRDSLAPVVQRLERKAADADRHNAVLGAVYHSLLGKVYLNGFAGEDSCLAWSRRHYALSLAHPEQLARAKATGYEPAVKTGYDSRVFGHDLLSVLSFEAHSYQAAHQYYATHYNRAATMLMALRMLDEHKPWNPDHWRKSRHIARLDSLIYEYADLTECGEAAIARYNYMSDCRNTTNGERVAWINYALDKWGSWPHLNTLRNEKTRLTNPSVSLELDGSCTSPVRPLRGVLHTTNAGRVTVSATRLNTTGWECGYNNEAILKDEAALRKLLLPRTRQTMTRNYVGLPEYETRDDSIELQLKEPGVYLVEVASDKAENTVSRQLCYVTTLFVINQALSKHKIRYAIVDAQSGQPVAGAHLRLYYRKMGPNYPERTVNLTADKKGEVIWQSTGERSTPDYIWAWTPQDKSFPAARSFTQYYRRGSSGKRKQTLVYTDRAVYRPGQTVRVSVVAYSQDDLKVNAAEGKSVKLTLKDTRYKDVATRTLTTDAYGTASTDVVLPQGMPNGTWSLTCGDGGWHTFQVAEYKRPTFDVTLPEVKAEYHEGDTLVVTGTARTYAGMPVAHGKVAYNVWRREAFYRYAWTPRSGNADTMLEQAETTTDEQGHFTMEIPMTMPDEGRQRFFNIRTSVTVTDANGETHDASLTLPLGAKSTLFDCNVPDKALADSLRTIRFTQRNLAGLELDAEVAYTIDGRTATARTGTDVALTPADLTSGQHTLHAVCGTDTIDTRYVVFRFTDPRPVVKTKDWMYCSADRFADASTPVYVQVGSSDKGVHVFYTLFSDKEMIESGTFELDNSNHNRRFDYKPAYGKQLICNYAWVRDGQLYYHKVRIDRPVPDKRLAMKWSTFRDRLTPGQKEEWRLHLTTPDGKPAKAQLMAVIYDKSLDRISRHTWSLNIGFDTPFLSSSCQTINNYHAEFSLARPWTALKDMAPEFTRLDTRLADLTSRVFIRGLGGSGLNEPLTIGYHDMASRKNVPASAQAGMVLAKKQTLMNTAEAKEESAPQAPHADDAAPGIQVRENLQETAFFYPALETDDKGDVALRFTLPESVTTWHFMGLAHDREMRSALLEGDAVAQKSVMIEPNLPRFLRRGDKGTLSARISNTTDKTLQGTARLVFINPETRKTVAQSQARFTAEPGSTTAVTFPVDVNAMAADGCSLLVCKATAEAAGCTDGEQHYLPILSDRQPVVSTQPFTIVGAGEKTLDVAATLAGMKNASQTRVSLEYTAHPAWLLIQSLPSLTQPDSKNAVSLCASFYANALARHLVQAQPRIKDVMARWKQELGTETSETSQLAKNQDVKDLLLAETPWTADAADETEQHRQLINFFDGNMVDNRQETLLAELTKLQRPDGSFSWFPGMAGSRYLTGEVALQLTRLAMLTGEDTPAASAVRTRALGYMLDCMVKDVARMKQQEKQGHKVKSLDSESLLQLYVTALDQTRMKDSRKDAHDYLMNILVKQPVFEDIRSKALAAVVLARTGHKNLAKDYVESIRQHTVCTETMGRYFDGARAAYSWSDYRMPTQVTAVEALQLVAPDDRQTISEMQRWILQQKRTQRWTSPVVAMESIYAFFVPKAGKQPDLGMLSDTSGAEITADGHRLPATATTAGLGYVKVTLPASGVKTVRISKSATDTSWGALYVSGVQPMADVEAASKGLSVKREVMGGKALKVGDKVKVRLTVKADRDYDFVQLQDRRAACLEPVDASSGYRQGAYVDIKDASTRYYMDRLPKGKTILETEYYIDRKGDYTAGAVTVQCAYAPEYAGRDKGTVMQVEE